ncbi:hypothetical protein FB468_1408 [Leucobacter komagatae]|uniref:DUF1648 domain-containing protein n=1 Tax=Leucobacter komagatae TaxID=55969 RepID=A0A542Y5Q1_9MICO|nr:hypothetical protein [Leucobacter komagatae]TQL43387.1 hypothetical protein FB468_1408 [Leucobacter komagatae]
MPSLTPPAGDTDSAESKPARGRQGPRRFAGLSAAELSRVITAGVALPALFVLCSWVIESSWTDLPGRYPAHWGKGGVDRFSSPQEYINTQAVAAAVAAVVTAGIAAGNLLGGAWSPLSRGFTSVGAGITGAIAGGFFVQLLRSRGLTTQAAIELGGGAGFLGVAAGFVALFALTFTLLPRGKYS